MDHFFNFNHIFTDHAFNLPLKSVLLTFKNSHYVHQGLQILQFINILSVVLLIIDFQISS